FFDAITCWRESLRFDPFFAETHFNLGLAYDKENMLEDAIFRYKKAIDYGSKDTKANSYTGLANIFWRLKKSPAEIQNFIQEANKINSEISANNNIEGLIFIEQGKYSEAEK